MSIIVGIDPGKAGAIAVIDTEAWTCAVRDMPVEIATAKAKSVTSPIGVAQVLHATGADHVFIEEVHSFGQEGVTSAFSFGRAYGICLGAASGANVMLWPTKPQVWKAAVKAPKDKKLAVARAGQLFPCANSLFYGPRGGIIDGRAEAMLIAFYGCMVLKHIPPRPLKLVAFPTLDALAA